MRLETIKIKQEVTLRLRHVNLTLQLGINGRRDGMKHEMMNMRAGRTKAQGQDYKGNHRE